MRLTRLKECFTQPPFAFTNNEFQNIEFPKFIKVLKEVTNDENYKNSSLAKL